MMELQYIKDVGILSEYFRNAPKSVKRSAIRVGDKKLHDALDLFLLDLDSSNEDEFRKNHPSFFE